MHTTFACYYEDFCKFAYTQKNSALTVSFSYTQKGAATAAAPAIGICAAYAAATAAAPAIGT